MCGLKPNLIKVLILAEKIKKFLEKFAKMKIFPYFYFKIIFILTSRKRKRK